MGGSGGLRRREDSRAGYCRDAVEATGQEAAPGTHEKTQSWREVGGTHRWNRAETVCPYHGRATLIPTPPGPLCYFYL